MTNQPLDQNRSSKHRPVLISTVEKSLPFASTNNPSSCMYACTCTCTCICIYIHTACMRGATPTPFSPCDIKYQHAYYNVVSRNTYLHALTSIFIRYCCLSVGSR